MKHLLEQLAIAQQALANASEIWENLTPEESDALNDLQSYPFAKSLDEIPGDIQSFINEIERL